MKTDIALTDEGLARPEHDLAERLRFWRRSVAKQKWAALGVALSVILTTCYFVFSATPIYVAFATLYIEPDRVKVVKIDEVYGGGTGAGREHLQTQAEIIKSHDLHKKLVRKLKLHVTPAVANEPKTEAEAQASPLMTAWLPTDWLPSSWLALMQQPDKPAATEEEQITAIAGAIGGGLKVDIIRNSQLIRISFESADREFAARIPNALAEAYIENDLDGRMKMTQQANAWLTERLAGLRQKVTAAEQGLQSFRDREKIVAVNTVALSGAGNQLFQLTGNLVVLRQKRTEAENDHNLVQAALKRKDPLDSIPAIKNNPAVQRAKNVEIDLAQKLSETTKRYGHEHPRMIALDAEVKAARDNTQKQMELAVAAVRTAVEVARANEQSVERALAETKSSIHNMNRKEFDLGVLEREVTASRQLYDMFLSRFRETSVARDMQSTIARVIDPATVPEIPVRPNKRKAIMFATMLGVMLGIMLAFLLEHLDNTVKSADDVEQKLRAPLLAVLQKLKSRDTDELAYVVLGNAQPIYAESIRTLRTSVMMSALDDPHKVLLVTSSVPEEGKTTVAINLAVAFGQIKKVCLVDADMRRPSIAKNLKIDRSAPGLSHLVAGTEPAANCIHLDKESGIHVLPSGVVPPNPQELLSSRRFSDVMKDLHKMFDIVVIDSPPLQLMSDALVLSSHVNAVIYVVKANFTPHQISRAGLERLRKVGAPTLGVVLNQLDTRKADKYYGYGKYSIYGKDYGYYSSAR